MICCLRTAGVLALVLLALGARAEDALRDPFEAYNRRAFALNNALDRHLIRPAAVVYDRMVPAPLGQMIYRFFDNLAEPVSMTGALLQGDGERTLTATGRFVVNSTLGLGGFFDPATAMGFVDVDEDIGQALDSWGLDQTPYLVLPFWGPGTLTTLPDRVLVWWLPPQLLGDYWLSPLRVVDTVSYRASLLGATTLLEGEALDPYAFARDSYLQRRRQLRNNGAPSPEALDALLDDF
jgi:phospholipid-binding lipoprotein MlaA